MRAWTVHQALVPLPRHVRIGARRHRAGVVGQAVVDEIAEPGRLIGLPEGLAKGAFGGATHAGGQARRGLSGAIAGKRRGDIAAIAVQCEFRRGLGDGLGDLAARVFVVAEQEGDVGLDVALAKALLQAGIELLQARLGDRGDRVDDFVLAARDARGRSFVGCSGVEVGTERRGERERVLHCRIGCRGIVRPEVGRLPALLRLGLQGLQPCARDLAAGVPGQAAFDRLTLAQTTAGCIGHAAVKDLDHRGCQLGGAAIDARHAALLGPGLELSAGRGCCAGGEERHAGAHDGKDGAAPGSPGVHSKTKHESPDAANRSGPRAELTAAAPGDSGVFGGIGAA